MIKRALSAVVIVVLLAAPASSADNEFRPGQAAVVSQDGARVGVGGETKATLKEGTRVNVVAVKGDWIGVSATVDGETVNGWMRNGDLEPASPAFPTDEPESPVEKLIKDGENWMEKEDYDTAFVCSEEALKIDPQCSEAYRLRGNARQKKSGCSCPKTLSDELAEAVLSDYSNAIRLDPSNATAYTDRAFFHAERGKPDLALADCKQALTVNPEDALAFALQGLAYRRKGDCERALVDYTRAIKLEPKTPLYLEARASCYGEMGKNDEALADLTSVTELAPDKACGFASRGDFYQHVIRAPEKAIQDYAKAVHLDPSIAWVHHNMGWIYLNSLKDPDRAIEKFTEVIKFEPGGGLNASALYGRAEAFQRKGDLDKAISELQEAVQLAPQDSTPHFRIGMIYLRVKNQPEQAKRYFEEALKRDPKHVESVFHLADSHWAVGDLETAFDLYTKTVDLNPDHFWGHHHLGRIHLNREDFAKAVAESSEAIRVKPDLPGPYRQRAAAYTKLGEEEKAATDLAKAESLEKK